MAAAKNKKKKKPAPKRKRISSAGTVDIARTKTKPNLVMKVDSSSPSFYRLHAMGGT